VFPAPAGMAGMNRMACAAGTTFASVPRTRGDEPYTGRDVATTELCSPLTQGWPASNVET